MLVALATLDSVPPPVQHVEQCADDAPGGHCQYQQDLY